MDSEKRVMIELSKPMRCRLEGGAKGKSRVDHSRMFDH